ncbi:hypothetical protein BDR05DRAFT_864990, partial [Suillus weaverae]
DFDGNRENTQKFLCLVTLYLDINAKIYPDDTKKIAFALSFMKEGTAASWMEDYIKHAHKYDPLMKEENGYGSWLQFINQF